MDSRLVPLSNTEAITRDIVNGERERERERETWTWDLPVGARSETSERDYGGRCQTLELKPPNSSLHEKVPFPAHPARDICIKKQFLF
jgi:hypothetical protein